jgi:hypothetical protein
MKQQVGRHNSNSENSRKSTNAAQNPPNNGHTKVALKDQNVKLKTEVQMLQQALANLSINEIADLSS